MLSITLGQARQHLPHCYGQASLFRGISFTVKRQTGQQYLKFLVGALTLPFVINLTKHDKIALKKRTQNSRNRKIPRIKFLKLNYVFLGNFSHLSALRDKKTN